LADADFRMAKKHLRDEESLLQLKLKDREERAYQEYLKYKKDEDEVNFR
jgi:hypothetical protein